MVQVGRQGNPLFCEGLVGVQDKDRYNRTTPEWTRRSSRYALEPELVNLIDALVGLPEDRTANRTDIPRHLHSRTIKVDLSTAPARLAGGPDDADSRGWESLAAMC